MARSRHATLSRQRFMRGVLAAAGAATGAWLGARPAFGLRLNQARSRVQELHFVAGDGASTSDLPGLDFITSGADLGIIAAANFQMGLLYLGGDGNLYNGLAQNYNVSDDLLTYTFTLAPGLRWSDGSPFTARDIKYLDFGPFVVGVGRGGGTYTGEGCDGSAQWRRAPCRPHPLPSYRC